MSYDLSFWKENTALSCDPHSIYTRLSEGHHVDGIALLPTIEIAAAVEASFDDGWMQESSTCWRHPERGAFEVTLTNQLFRVDCYGMSGDDMNRFIDIGALFECPLYDPQIDQRFDDTW